MSSQFSDHKDEFNGAYIYKILLSKEMMEGLINT